MAYAPGLVASSQLATISSIVTASFCPQPSSFDLLENITIPACTVTTDPHADTMKISSVVSGLAASVLPTALCVPAGNSSSCGGCRTDVASKQYHQQIATNYLAFWSGNLSLADSLLHPELTLYADRLPSGNSSVLIRITTKEEFVAFVQRSRTGWETYGFDMIHWVGDENQLAFRWKMNGLTGTNMAVPTTLSPGSPVTYNGTDFVVLDECDGLIKEINMAQDFISFFHALGLTGVTV